MLAISPSKMPKQDNIGIPFQNPHKCHKENAPQLKLLYSALNSNHREVNRQYYPTEQLRQSNAIKKNDSTHKA